MAFDWLAAAQRLRALAQTGLTYTQGHFDRERYVELMSMSLEMLAELLESTPAVMRDVFALEQGYPTPKVDVRTAVFSEGKVLLVKEMLDGKWTFPGGWADELDSPRTAAEREVLEESGYIVRCTRLVAIKDRRLHAYQPQHLGGIYKLIFLGELLGGEARISHETTEVGFFSPDELPPLSLSRTLAEDVAQALVHHQDATLAPTFD
ncbi:MAG TPA: NUDIX hydrolase N-terminal domain-containing protein [Polyangiaceae bacterium]|nr:NUDIX hydrolase N-terminal domain-containing protein [Polyangiaceae bacterium]